MIEIIEWMLGLTFLAIVLGLVPAAPYLDGDARNKDNKTEDDREHAIWWLIRLERGYE